MDLITYKPLFWLLLLIPIMLVFIKTLVNRPHVLKWASFLLRVAGLLLLVIVLCGPYWFQQSQQMHIAFLIDISSSVDLGKTNVALDDIRQKVNSLSSGDSYTIYSFAEKVSETTLPELEKQIAEWQKSTTTNNSRKATKLASAISAVKLAFPANKSKSICLYSDGMDTDGNLAKTISTLKKDNITLYFSPVSSQSFPEAAVISLTPNSTSAYAGEVLRLTAKVASNQPMPARLRFINRGIVLKEIPIKLNGKGVQSFHSDFVVNEDIRDSWEAEIFPEKDHFPVNNKSSCTITVKGTPKVLVVHQKPSELSDFRKALRHQGIELEVRGRLGLPETIPEMLEFDAIILADLPAMDLNSRQMNNIKRYVTDFGRGFMMTGSENSFGLGGYYKTPVEDVLPVISRYEKEKEQPSLAMALVIDKSGSMGGMPIELASEAAKATVELLSPRDHIAVIAFDGQANEICSLTSAVNSSNIINAIDSIGAGGGTNMYPAMEMGKEMLERAHTKIKHMIILTDGQSQAGDFEGLASEMGDLGMTVSTVALGSGAAGELLNRIAELGRGRFYETNDYEAMPRIFTKETMEASRSAIKEEPFLPVKIGDADYLQGIDFSSIPFLLGYVMTRAKPTVKTQLLTEQGDPLLAIGRFGLGKGASFTSDMTKKWAGEWLDWKDFGKFWSQVLRSIIRSSSTEGLETKVSQKGFNTIITIKRYNDAGEPLNNIKWKAQLFTDNNPAQTITTKQIGLGLYQVSYPTPNNRNQTLQLTDQSYNKSKTLHFPKNYPKEFLLGNDCPAAIANLPKLPAGPLAITHPVINIRQYIGNYLCILALLLFLSGVLLRRI